MRRKSEPNEDCKVCYLSDCDCECKTCTDARERNRTLEPEELIMLNVKHAIEEKDA